MRKTGLLILVFTCFYCIGYAQQIVGMKLGDSGRVTITTKPSCCNPGQIRDQFTFDPDGNFLARGEIGIGKIPIEGPAYRTTWHTYKAAFRSRYADKEWNDSATGFFSWAGGANNTASGLYSFAFGDKNYATLTSSIAFGSGNKVHGAAGFSAGASNEVNGTYGVALGNKARSRNIASFALGSNLVAKGYASTVVGMFNDSLLTTEDNSTSPTTPLFIVGNGSSDAARSNALVVRKNGDVEAENMRIGGGTVVSKQQQGTFQAGSNNTQSKTVTFIFPTAFTVTPRIVATTRNETGSNYPDVFVLTVRSISTTQVTLNIIRLDATVGWSQYLLIDYLAWQ